MKCANWQKDTKESMKIAAINVKELTNESAGA